jgi:hypothetical protein
VNGESRIDIGQLAASGHRYEVNVSSESAEDAAARRGKEAADARLGRVIRLLLVVFAVLLTSAIFAGCVIVFASGSPDDRKWAAGIVSAIASGLIGFLVGQGRGAK